MDKKEIIENIYDSAIYFRKLLKKENIQNGDLIIPDYAVIKSKNDFYNNYDFRSLIKKTKLKSYRYIEELLDSIDGAITILQRIDVLILNDNRLNDIYDVVGDNYDRKTIKKIIVDKYSDDFIDSVEIYVKLDDVLAYLESKYALLKNMH